MLLSTGMSTEEEINETYSILTNKNKKEMENENPPNLLKISSTNTEKKTIKKKSNFCILYSFS